MNAHFLCVLRSTRKDVSHSPMRTQLTSLTSYDALRASPPYLRLCHPHRSGVSPEKDQTFPRTAINLSLHYTRGKGAFLESRLIKIVITAIAGRYSFDNRCRGYPVSFPSGKNIRSLTLTLAPPRAPSTRKRTCYFSSNSSTRPLRYQPVLEQSYGIKNARQLRCRCIFVSSK